MPDTCRTCDFYLDRGLASASSPPSEKDPLDFTGGICRRHAPTIAGDADYRDRWQFTKVHGDQWCGDFHVAARAQSPC